MFKNEAARAFKKKYPENTAINSYYVEGFIDGYNKANEWHYMKDGIMPKENQEVLVYFTLPDKSKNDIMLAEFENNDFNYVDLQDVIAWYEIPNFKE